MELDSASAVVLLQQLLRQGQLPFQQLQPAPPQSATGRKKSARVVHTQAEVTDWKALEGTFRLWACEQTGIRLLNASANLQSVRVRNLAHISNNPSGEICLMQRPSFHRRRPPGTTAYNTDLIFRVKV